MRVIKLLLIVILGSPLLLIGGLLWLLVTLLRRPYWIGGMAAIVIGSALAAPLNAIVVIGGLVTCLTGVLLDAGRGWDG